MNMTLRLCVSLFGALFASSIPACAESPPNNDTVGRSVQADVSGQRGDQPWSVWLSVRCASLVMYNGREAACMQDHDALRVALENAEQQPVAAEWLLPFTPPKSWWGIDPIAAANLPRGGEHNFELLISRDGRFVVHVFGSGRQVWIDAYSGQVRAWDNSPSDLLPIWQQQHSLRLISPQAMMMAPNHFTIFFGSNRCGSPLGFGGEYFIETSPGQTLGTPMIFRRFEGNVRTLFPGSCEEVKNTAFEADFRPLALGIAGRFPDGTLLLVAQDQSAGGEHDLFIFRAHYDLSSPFFHGRTDYVRVTPDALPSLMNSPDQTKAKLDAAITKAVASQTETK